MDLERFLEDFQVFCDKHLGKRNTLTAYSILEYEDLLISFLLSSYNCYVIKLHSKRNGLYMITNPNELWNYVDYEKQIICIDNIKMLIEDKVKNYESRKNTTNQENGNG